MTSIQHLTLCDKLAGKKTLPGNPRCFTVWEDEASCLLSDILLIHTRLPQSPQSRKFCLFSPHRGHDSLWPKQSYNSGRNNRLQSQWRKLLFNHLPNNTRWNEHLYSHKPSLLSPTWSTAVLQLEVTEVCQGRAANMNISAPNGRKIRKWLVQILTRWF